jgi:hypothetical protein
MDDYHQLGVGDSASIVSALEVLHWGGELVLHCLYHPRERRAYTLHFMHCRNVQLDPLDNGTVSEASLIGITLGSGAHQKPAIVTTNAFELSILYEKWELKWT